MLQTDAFASIQRSKLPVRPELCPNPADGVTLQRFPRSCSWFLPARRYASAGISDRNVSVRPSVCPSVRLSRAGIVSKRRKLAEWFLHHLVAPRL